MNRKDIGELAEAKVLAALVATGKNKQMKNISLRSVEVRKNSVRLRVVPPHRKLEDIEMISRLQSIITSLTSCLAQIFFPKPAPLYVSKSQRDFGRSFIETTSYVQSKPNRRRSEAQAHFNNKWANR